MGDIVNDRLILYVLKFYNRRTLKLEEMGCQTSSQQSTHGHTTDALKRNNKKMGKIIGRASRGENILENVKEINETISSSNQQKIDKIISSHFFFSNFSPSQRLDLIAQMKSYSSNKQQYIFKQSDPGSLFFIIKKGIVRLEINGKKIKSLQKGQYFGQLSLLYTAPRSASALAQTNCQFWCLHQSKFKNYIEELLKKNYIIAKPLLQKVPLFQFLPKNQINAIAYAMNSLNYSEGGEIFKEGDDANAFYIIVQGMVTIRVPGKDPIILNKGESFGQNSLKKCEVRGGTAIATGKGCKLLSIGRDGLQKCLGNQIDELIEYNIIKWALKRSTIFGNIPDELIKKFIQIAQIRQINNNQIICKRGESLKYLFGSLSGEINQFNQGVIVNENMLKQDNSSKSNVYSQHMKKKGKGNIFLFQISKIEKLLKIDLAECLRKNQNIFKEFQSMDKSQILSVKIFDNNKRNNVNFNDLMYERKLGEGQFGKVYLVEDKNTGNKYALKCIKKKQVVELGMEEFVVNEKKVIEELNHPLIVKFQKSYKDQAFLYILMQYIDGVDFFDMLREIGLCNSLISRFYLACLIYAIEEIHGKNIIYRDLKPENAVIDSKGFLYLTDMGTAKRLCEDKGNRTFTIIGTPHYMAPEIMEGKGYGLQADIWSLGIIFYEMVCGKLPYGDDLQDPYGIYRQIVASKLIFPKFYTNKLGKSLIQRLLQINVAKRAVQNFNELKNNAFFQNFGWEQLFNKTMKPPVAPRKKVRKEESEAKVPIAKFMEKDIKKSAYNKSTDWDAQF